jgi:tetratricopeptide (TPR) repeat protein
LPKLIFAKGKRKSAVKKNFITMLMKFIFLLGSVFLLSCGPINNLNKVTVDYQQITAQYEARIKNNPRDLTTRLELARFYYRFNDFSAVKKLLQDNSDIAAQKLLAQTYFQLNELPQALEIFEKLGEIDDSEYLYFYALLLEKKSLFPRAVKIYSKVTGQYTNQARERIKDIGVKIEDGVPQDIQKLIEATRQFVEGIEKEEVVILLANETIKINSDNTSVSDIHVVKKVLREKGKNQAEVEIGYDSTYERVELEYARTITASGQVVYAGKEAIRDVSRYLNFPLYSNARAFIISLPAVEVGAIIEYKLKIHSRELIDNDNFSFTYSLREQFPLALANFVLTVPQGKAVNLKFINEQYSQGVTLKPDKRQQDTNTVYTWKFKNIAPIIPEDYMPPAAEINPAILISSFNNWDQIYQWWKKLYSDKLELTPAIKKFTDDLIKDCSDPKAKAKKIYQFCSQQIRYVAVEYGQSGHEPHKSSDIFINRYGDCKDKAILLIAMCRYAGLNAYPVLIPTRDNYPIFADVPSINFNHAIAAIEIEEKLIFVDPTALTVSFFDLPIDDQDRDVLVFGKDKYQIVRTPVISDNLMAYFMDINIDQEENALIQRRVEAVGFFAAAQRYYLKYSHPQIIEDEIKNRMTQISPFSQLKKYNFHNQDDLDKPPILEYEFTTRNFLNPAGDLRVIPGFDDINIAAAVVGKNERNFPIDLNTIYRRTSKITITLPKNQIVKFLPLVRSIDTKWFSFKSGCQQKENMLNFYQEISIKERFVYPQEYSEFKREIEKILFYLKEEIILDQAR